jgi:hypothetical protein
MPTHRATWIGVMGAPTTTIVADYDLSGADPHVTIDGDTLGRMVETLDAAGIFDEPTTDMLCRAMWALRPDEAGRFDIVNLHGSGLSHWLDVIEDCGCGHPSHPGRPCNGTGAELDPIYAVPSGEACVCTTDTDPDARES